MLMLFNFDKKIDILKLQTGDHPSPSKLIERRSLCFQRLGRFNEAAEDLESICKELSKEAQMHTGGWLGVVRGKLSKYCFIKLQ